MNYLTVDISPSSSLQWHEVRSAAKNLIAEGKKIGWILETGLFLNLPYPLEHEGQFRNLSLGLCHFMDTLGQEFASSTQKIILYKGKSFFSRHEFLDKTSTYPEWVSEKGMEIPIHGSKEETFLFHLFALDLMAHYLVQLGKEIPEKWGPYLLWDPWPKTLLEEAVLTNPERWGGIKISWEGRKNRWELSSDTAIYCPSVHAYQPSYFFAFANALEKEPTAKWIAEERLTTSWEGLNTLWVVQEALSFQGKRMVDGFLAAGGEIQLINP